VNQESQVHPVSRRVIVADDSPVVRELIAVNLELEGLEVEQCGDGAEALRRIAARPPDLVMLDIVMPVMDGFSALEQIRADPRIASLPVVLVTGRASAADLARGRELGVDTYVTKPFEPTELVGAVLGLLEARR
jgi:CheY-like chemotaxis protein